MADLEDVTRVALALWTAHHPAIGVVFEVDGRWIHAMDYADLDADDWDAVEIEEHVILWENPKWTRENRTMAK